MGLVAAQVVVDLNLAVAPALEASGVERAAVAVGGAVCSDGVAVTGRVGVEAFARTLPAMVGEIGHGEVLLELVHKKIFLVYTMVLNDYRSTYFFVINLFP